MDDQRKASRGNSVLSDRGQPRRRWLAQALPKQRPETLKRALVAGLISAPRPCKPELFRIGLPHAGSFLSLRSKTVA